IKSPKIRAVISLSSKIAALICCVCRWLSSAEPAHVSTPATYSVCVLGSINGLLCWLAAVDEFMQCSWAAAAVHMGCIMQLLLLLQHCRLLLIADVGFKLAGCIATVGRFIVALTRLAS
ncbi:hypothetical protein Dimus_020618, partial [Dionaea muscipula]